LGIEDEVLHDEAAVRRESPVGTAEDVPVLFLGKHVANRVKHDDVVSGAKVALEHVARAEADLGWDAGLADIFGGEWQDLWEVKDLALHIGRTRKVVGITRVLAWRYGTPGRDGNPRLQDSRELF
jgi:hypothetical protein